MPDFKPVPGGARVLVWDNSASSPTPIDAGQYDAALASGQYRAIPGANVTTVEGGTATIPHDPSSGAALIKAGMATQDLGAKDAAAAANQRRRDSFDTVADGIATIGSGLVDTATLGAYHDTSTNNIIRDSVHSGKYMAAAIAGYLIPGAGEIKALGSAGKLVGAVGKFSPVGLAERGLNAVTHGIVPKGASAAILKAGVQGGLTNAGLAAAHDLVSATTDAIIEDKRWAVESIANNATLAGLLGGGLSIAGAALSHIRARDVSIRAIKDQDGILNAKSATSRDLHQNINDAVVAEGAGIDVHGSSLAAYDDLVKAGKLAGDDAPLMAARRAAYAEAKAAHAKLAKINLDDVMASGSSVDDVVAARDAINDLSAKAEKLHKVMRPPEPGFGGAEPYRPPPEVTPAEVAAFDAAENAAAAPSKTANLRKEVKTANLRVAAEPVPVEPGVPGVPEPASPPARSTNPIKRGLGDGNFELHDGRVMDMPAIRAEMDAGLRSSEAYRQEALLHEQLVASIKPKAPIEAGTVPNGQRGLVEPATPVDPAATAKLVKPLVDPYAKTAKLLAKADAADAVVAAAQSKVDSALFKSDAAKLEKTVATSKRAAAQAHAEVDAAIARDAGAKPAPKPPANYEGPGAAEKIQQVGESVHRVDAGDVVAAKIKDHIAKIEELTGGRLSSVSSLEVALGLGLPAEAALGNAPLADQMVRLWSMRQLPELVRAASKGPIPSSHPIVKNIARRAAGFGVAKLGSHLFGPIGWLAGLSIGGSGALASSVGKARQLVTTAAAKLLNPTMTKALSRAALPSLPKAYSYDGTDPTTDLKTRLDQLHSMVADPNAAADRIRKHLGDYMSSTPEMAEGIVAATLRRAQYLASVAPQYQETAWGIVPPPASDIRRFLVKEAIINDHNVALGYITSGQVTPDAAEALHAGHPEMMRIMTTTLTQDPDNLAKLPRAHIKQVEIITGMQLSPTADPMAVSRQQANWVNVQQDKAAQSGGALSPTPFAGQPLPSQAQGGRAPGN